MIASRRKGLEPAIPDRIDHGVRASWIRLRDTATALESRTPAGSSATLRGNQDACAAAVDATGDLPRETAAHPNTPRKITSDRSGDVRHDINDQHNDLEDKNGWRGRSSST